MNEEREWWETPPPGEPILGWRAWIVEERPGTFEYDDQGLWRRVAPGGLRLVSLNGTTWEPRREMTYSEGAPAANCAVSDPREKHPGTNPGCSCGIYAHGTRELLMVELHAFMSHGDKIMAFGRVGLRGNWVRGAKGWRAQYAYPYDIYLVDCGDMNVAREIASLYAIDVDYGARPSDLSKPAVRFTMSGRPSSASLVGTKNRLNALGQAQKQMTAAAGKGHANLVQALVQAGDAAKAARVCHQHGSYNGGTCPTCFRNARGPRRK